MIEMTVDNKYLYTVGTFDKMADAEVYKNELLKMGIEGAMVVPFKERQRISSEQAKMLEESGKK